MLVKRESAASTLISAVARKLISTRATNTRRGSCWRLSAGRWCSAACRLFSSKVRTDCGSAGVEDLASAPLGLRTPVTYERGFVDHYRPNESSLLPPELARTLYDRGRPESQFPAGTLAMRVLEQLLIDLSWHSSHLEGNRKSLLDTRELFATGQGDPDDPDVAMLLNHKQAIEFMVEQAPLEGLTMALVRNLHAILMQNLLQDPTAAGDIRRRVVIIDSSVYQPAHVPALLEEMLRLVIDKAREIRNPIEASFFLWINIAYLQPFEEGNKRTSRLSANLPLLMSNCAPLSFLDVEPEAYAYANALGGVELRVNLLALTVA